MDVLDEQEELEYIYEAENPSKEYLKYENTPFIEERNGSTVEVRPSQITNGGYGLFALRDFKKGEFLTEYAGITVNYQTTLDRLLKLGKNTHLIPAGERGPPWVDAHAVNPCRGWGLGGYANSTWKTSFKRNCTYQKDRYDSNISRYRPFLKATVPIRKDEEIFVDYGNFYEYDGKGNDASRDKDKRGIQDDDRTKRARARKQREEEQQRKLKVMSQMFD